MDTGLVGLVLAVLALGQCNNLVWSPHPFAELEVCNKVFADHNREKHLGKSVQIVFMLYL